MAIAITMRSEAGMRRMHSRPRHDDRCENRRALAGRNGLKRRCAKSGNGKYSQSRRVADAQARDGIYCAVLCVIWHCTLYCGLYALYVLYIPDRTLGRYGLTREVEGHRHRPFVSNNCIVHGQLVYVQSVYEPPYVAVLPAHPVHHPRKVGSHISR